jgi:hypothetical protein
MPQSTATTPPTLTLILIFILILVPIPIILLIHGHILIRVQNAIPKLSGSNIEQNGFLFPVLLELRGN